MKALVLILFLAIPSLIYCESVIFDKHPIFNECSRSSQSKIKIYISLDTNYYLFGEPVWLTVRIVNEGSKADSIENLYAGELLPNIKMLNGSGAIMEYKGLIGCSWLKKYSVIEPGEMKVFQFELRSVYGNKDVLGKRATFGLWNVFDVDSYSLCLRKYNTDLKKYNVSNYIYFNIIMPDEEECDVFSKLQEIYKMQDYNFELAQKKKAAFNTILPEIIDSKYYSEAFSKYVSLRYFFKQDDYKTLSEDLFRFMDNFPDDYLNGSHLWHYYEAFIKNGGEKQTALDNLSKLKEANLNSRFSGEIERFIISKQNQK